MGWKPGKYLKKAWKGVKKVVKKIGRGIKKVAKGFMKAIGKLGVVGQLGLMFFMPYAMGALSSMFGNMIGAAGNWLSTTANAFTSGSSFIGKALGHTMSAIHKIGSGIGHVYSTITETISGAVNSFADATGLGKGFDAVGNFFHEKVVNPTKQFFGFETSAYKPMFAADTSGTARDIDIDDLTDTKVKTDYDPSKQAHIDVDGISIQKDPFDVPPVTAGTDISNKKLKEITGVDLTVRPDTKGKSLLDPFAKKIQGEIEVGLLGGIKQEARELITGKPPTANRFGGSQYNFGSTIWTDPNQISVWDGVFQKDQGNPWMSYGQQYYSQLQEGISNLLQDDVYEKEISAFERFGKQQQRLQPKPSYSGF